LLVQAARSAAEADGLKPPEAGDEAKAAKAATEAKIHAAKKAEETAIAQARQAAAEAEATKKAAAEIRSAGSAAHAMMANTAASAPTRKSPGASAPAASSNKKKGPPLRRGKWTAEEEAYANRLIQEFKAGLLPLTDGTTLRTFLSKLLNCDPMRISKKFVGSNCIGKQVFRRRTADINRLTPGQIQQSRNELSELERRFLERVAQTNRVKSSGPPSSQAGQAAVGGEAQKTGLGEKESPPSPPWLQAPMGYKQGTGAAMAAAALQGSNNRAAAAGRALLGGSGASAAAAGGLGQKKGSLSHSGSAGLLAFAELQARRSQQNLLNMGAKRTSASNLLAAASAGSSSGLSNSAMAQIARNASAARLAGLTAAGNSMNNLMLKTGLSRDQLTQLAREQGMTPNASLNNMMERQSSFDALMSLDFQSLQSIDNLANLIQTGGKSVPEIGMKNADFSSNGLVAAAAHAAKGSSGNLGTSLANARRLASAGRMESLLRSLSSGNVKNAPAAGLGGGSSSNGGGSNANFSNLLQTMQSNLNSLGGSGNSANSLFGSGGANSASALSLANMLRADSSTGLTALRQQDGLTQRKTSVDDFLSLVASGDIPHQDPTLLNVPLMQQQAAAAAQQQGGGSSSSSGAQAAATYLAQQQLLAQAANSGNAAALTSALARAGSFSNLGSSSHASFGGIGSQSSLSQLLARDNSSSAALKRKIMEMSGEYDDQGNSKR